MDSAVLASTRVISEPNRKALSGFVATVRELGKATLSAARKTWTTEVALLESDGRMVAGQLRAEALEESPLKMRVNLIIGNEFPVRDAPFLAALG